MNDPDDQPPFEVYSYDIDRLRSLLASKSGASPDILDGKTHLTYFKEYFAELGAKTILVENRYVDRDFLEDFAAYYVRCFQPYKKLCTRLHFFRSSFNCEEFAVLLGAKSGSLTADGLDKNYLGFVVVKPLPRTIIGRTCLRAYPDDNGRRHYPIIRPYKATPFGIKLTVDTLAFQEQDRVAAACATSALWSAFQGTGLLFQHSIPSPVEITKAANERFPIETRTLPSHGLTIQQMAHAVCNVGLEPLAFNVLDDSPNQRRSYEFILRSSTYAYLRGGIPVLLVIGLFDTSVTPHKPMGKHAVAVTGFGVLMSGSPKPGPNGFLSRSETIDRIYAHDDQVGPFARMVLDGIPVTFGDPNGPHLDIFSLSTSWKNDFGDIGHVRAVPETLLIPLYHKIRIPSSRAEDAVIEFDSFLEELRKLAGSQLFSERLVWDIYLATVNEIKSTIFNNPALDPRLRSDFLTRSLPRFMWRATALDKNIPVLDLLFDATDIEQGRLFVTGIEYNPLLSDVLRTIAEPSTLDPLLAVIEPKIGALPAVREILEQFR